MAKPEWGKKRICGACGALFYDLNQENIVCPSCGADFDPEALLRTRRTRSGGEERQPENVEPAHANAASSEEADIDEVVFDEDEEDTKDSELHGEGANEDADSGISIPDDVGSIGVVDDDDNAEGVTIEDVSELDDSDDDIAAVIKGDDED